MNGTCVSFFIRLLVSLSLSFHYIEAKQLNEKKEEHSTIYNLSALYNLAFSVFNGLTHGHLSSHVLQPGSLFLFGLFVMKWNVSTK